MRVLGISRVSDLKRVFLPKAVREELKITENQGLKFYIKERKVVVVASAPGEGKTDSKGRIYLPHQISERLSLKRGDDIIFLRGDSGEIFIAKLEEVDARL